VHEDAAAPCELSVIPKPSMLDGLHQKLLGNGFLAVLVFDPQVLAVSNVVPTGKPARRAGSQGLAPWKFATFRQHRNCCPSNAPMSEGSCNNSAMFPLSPASHPTVASRGNRSDLRIIGSGVEGGPAVPASRTPPVGRTVGCQPEQTIDLHAPRVKLARGVGIRVEDAGGSSDTCSRTGFHISNSSLWGSGRCDARGSRAVTPAQVVPAGAIALGANVGSMMIKSPGAALSIALWIESRRGRASELCRDRDGHRIDRLLAVGRRDDQLAAPRL